MRRPRQPATRHWTAPSSNGLGGGGAARSLLRGWAQRLPRECRRTRCQAASELRTRNTKPSSIAPFFSAPGSRFQTPLTLGKFRWFSRPASDDFIAVNGHFLAPTPFRSLPADSGGKVPAAASDAAANSPSAAIESTAWPPPPPPVVMVAGMRGLFGAALAVLPALSGLVSANAQGESGPTALYAPWRARLLSSPCSRIMLCLA